jgi:nucleoid DNA-binding protein|tara:strand:+ start:2890 stop:3141 length:252 start_codon:yes stop_codon:yes gene_type:complete
MPKRNVEYYSRILALKHGITKSGAKLLLMHAFKNLAKNIEAGNDIRIPHFAHIYFNKKYFARYLKKMNENKESQKKNNGTKTK